LDAIKGDKMSGGGWFMGNNHTFHYSVNALVTKKGVRGSIQWTTDRGASDDGTDNGRKLLAYMNVTRFCVYEDGGGNPTGVAISEGAENIRIQFEDTENDPNPFSARILGGRDHFAVIITDNGDGVPDEIRTRNFCNTDDDLSDFDYCDTDQNLSADLICDGAVTAGPDQIDGNFKVTIVEAP
jgi:hypothetical protein